MSTTIISLTYPIDIKNIKPKELTLRSDFSSTRETVFDVTAFRSIKFHLAQYAHELTTKYPEHQYKIYAWRSTLAKGASTTTTVIDKVRLIAKVDNYKKFIHVSVELLPQEESPEEPLEEEESC